MVFLHVAGCLGLAGFGAAAAFFAFGYACEQARTLAWEMSRDAREVGRRDAGRELTNMAHWFAEDVSVWAALDEMGQVLTQTGMIKIDEVRNRWRKRIGVIDEGGGGV